MKFIYRLLLPCAAIFLTAVVVFVLPAPVMAADTSEQESTAEDNDPYYINGLPLYPTDVYGHHYIMVSSHSSDISTIAYYLLIFDDISTVTSDTTADDVNAGTVPFTLQGVNGIRYWYKYEFEDGWVKSSRTGATFTLNPVELQIHASTFDVPLTVNTSVTAIPANTEIIDNKKHIDGLGRLMFGSIDVFDSNYLGIMPLVCMISSAVVVFVHRMIGRGF